MTRDAWLLLLIAAPNGQPIDPVRLQKGMFLLTMGAVVPPEERYRFVPYSYGPMSRDIYADVRRLERRGLVHSEAVAGHGWRALRVTEAGEVTANRLRSAVGAKALRRVDGIRTLVDGHSFAELLEHVYERYPSYARRSVFRRRR